MIITARNSTKMAKECGRECDRGAVAHSLWSLKRKAADGAAGGPVFEEPHLPS